MLGWVMVNGERCLCIPPDQLGYTRVRLGSLGPFAAPPIMHASMLALAAVHSSIIRVSLFYLPLLFPSSRLPNESRFPTCDLRTKPRSDTSSNFIPRAFHLFPSPVQVIIPPPGPHALLFCCSAVQCLNHSTVLPCSSSSSWRLLWCLFVAFVFPNFRISASPRHDTITPTIRYKVRKCL